MTELQKKFIGFIPSQTMQDYLSQMISNGNWTPAIEDMVKIVKLNASFKLKFDRKSCIQFYKQSDLMYIESRLYGS